MKIIHGDSLEELKKLPENSIDSLVTDPPAGISFMGKKWDDDKGGRDQWIAWMSEVMTECKRVLKPGAHALVWAIPRTSHWTTTAIENAGFEIRDVVTHLFGSGFPKSLDISKAIDKEAGATREVTGTKDVGPDMRGGNFENAEGRMIQNITAPSTPNAKKWSGFGTALKPAAEFWILARKPLSEKTVAKNVLKWGTGGLNIGASRIEATDQHVLDAAVKRMTGNESLGWKNTSTKGIQPNSAVGRFPANLILDEVAAEMLDEQTGTLISGKPGIRKKDWSGYATGLKKLEKETGFGDSGGASRYFYCAKVSPSERGDSFHPTMKPQKLMQYLIRLITPPGGTVLDPFMGSGSTGLAAKTLGLDFVGIEKEREYVDIAIKRITPSDRIKTGDHGELQSQQRFF